tara:strand:+ start:544 stop:771 length:228 start_codon:yes stop_codon:yes gene_type:complete
MKTFNGHRSWNAWNVSLWLSNDEDKYKIYVLLIKDHGIKRAINIIYYYLKGGKTPDGASYNRLSVKLALEGLEVE